MDSKTKRFFYTLIVNALVSTDDDDVLQIAGMAVEGPQPTEVDEITSAMGMTQEEADVVVAFACQDWEDDWFETPAELARMKAANQAAFGYDW
jgi:hypothetical protein